MDEIEKQFGVSIPQSTIKGSDEGAPSGSTQSCFNPSKHD